MINYKQQQSGIVLVIGLIMLLLLTLIGVTGMQVSGFEEKMAGNSRDQNVAFQAAETALRAGERKIVAIGGLGAFDGSGELLGVDDALHDFSSSAIWASGSSDSVEVSSGLSGVATEPRYYIKFLKTEDDGSGGASININSYGNINAGAALSYFTVTARGTGGRDSSQVILRSYYSKRF